MINAIILLLMGIVFIMHFVITIFFRKKEFLLSKSIIINILIWFIDLIIGGSLITLGLILTYNINLYYYYLLKTILIYFIGLMIAIVLLTNVIVQMIKKEKILNPLNYSLCIFLVLFLLYVIRSFYPSKVDYNSTNEKIYVSDFLYKKTIKFEDLQAISINSYIPYNLYSVFGNSDLVGFKGLFYTSDNKWCRIFERIDSEYILKLETDNKIFYVGYDSELAVNAIYKVISDRIEKYNSEEANVYYQEINISENDIINDMDGHGSTAEESIEDYLKKHPDVSREDLNFDLSQFE